VNQLSCFRNASWRQDIRADFHSAANQNGRTALPLVRIDVPVGKPPEKRRVIADVVYDAMISTLNQLEGGPSPTGAHEV
jgi:hypothetical protein